MWFIGRSTAAAAPRQLRRWHASPTVAPQASSARKVTRRHRARQHTWLCVGGAPLPPVPCPGARTQAPHAPTRALRDLALHTQGQPTHMLQPTEAHVRCSWRLRGTAVAVGNAPPLVPRPTQGSPFMAHRNAARPTSSPSGGTVQHRGPSDRCIGAEHRGGESQEGGAWLRTPAHHSHATASLPASAACFSFLPLFACACSKHDAHPPAQKAG